MQGRALAAGSSVGASLEDPVQRRELLAFLNRPLRLRDRCRHLGEAGMDAGRDLRANPLPHLLRQGVDNGDAHLSAPEISR
jgi:hypothetical protein